MERTSQPKWGVIWWSVDDMRVFRNCNIDYFTYSIVSTIQF